MTTELAERRRYTEEDIRKGLTVVAWCAGNTRLASEQLEEAGERIPRATLQYWVQTKPDQYEEVRERILPQLEQRIAQEAEALVIHSADLERKILTRLEDKLDDLRPSEAAGALRNVTTSKGINFDKARLVRGQPTSITRTETDAAALLRAISIEGTAELDAGSR